MGKKYTKENYPIEKYDKDKKLVSDVGKIFHNFDDVDLDNPENIRYMKRILGNNLKSPVLRVGPDDSIEPFRHLNECAPKRIYMVLKSLYNSANERTEKFGNPAKKTIETITEKDGQVALVF